MTELNDIVVLAQRKVQEAEAAKAACKRKKRLDAMAANPQAVLDKIEPLRLQYKSSAYKEICQLLLELREALVNTEQASLPDTYAIKLKQDFPQSRVLIQELRRAGLVKK